MDDRRVVTDSAFADVQAARDRAAEIDIAMRRGVAGYPHRRPISLAQWVALCAAGWGVSAVTQELYEGHLRRHVLPVLGHMPLELITRADIQDLVTGLRATMSAKSAEDVMKVLSRIFNNAIDDGRISRNPCLRLKWHAVPKKRPWATPGQVLQIASHIRHWGYQLMVITAAYTGMRFGCGWHCKSMVMTLSS
jgi:integrase